MKSIVAFVHAKGTSDRVPNKNLQLLGDVPLFVHAIRHARATAAVTLTVVDSDSDEILALGQRHGAVPLKRPAALATNTATGDDLAHWQASNYPDSDIVLQVIPTAPFLTPASIGRAIQLIADTGVDSVVGVAQEVFYVWENGRPAYYRNGTIPNSSELTPLVFETTGLYVNRTAAVLAHKRRLNPDSCRPLLLSKLEAFDINNPEDLELARVIWRGFHPAPIPT